MISFSLSEMRRLLRSGPAITRAMASSSSSIPMTFLFARAARMAASLIRFARSAPLKPGVWRASTCRSTVESSGLLRACTSRIERRPLMSGRASETGGSKRRGHKRAGAVLGCDDDDVRIGVEAVHLDQQLVEGLLALVVAAAQAGAPLASDGVDLVDEHDARRVLLRLVEQVADAAGADADEHLDEL